jgi:toxin ParE1/3/4
MTEPRYSARARQDYLDIAAYIARDNPVAAARTVDRIESECMEITRQPERGDHHEDIPDHFLVRSVGRYLIVYCVEDDGVSILRIVHGARDLKRLFPDSF